MKKRPFIGITMRLEIETGRFYLGRQYSEAIERFGGIPVHIALIPDRDYIKEIIKNIDGIVLPGSDTDIDPSYYLEEPIPKLKTVVPEKDETDFLVLKEADKLNLPILAICYGMQSLNVFRGGSLFQDIETQIEDCIKHNQGLPLNRLSHSITVETESRLSSFIDAADLKEKAKVNSHHHQSVKKIGQNLIKTAWAKDGVIECIEDIEKERFVMGVQWHPEISFESDALSKEIFRSFLENCKSYAKSRGKTVE